MLEPGFFDAFVPVLFKVRQQPLIREVERMSVLSVVMQDLVQSIDDMLVVYLDR